jgi:hypothetical protein
MLFPTRQPLDHSSERPQEQDQVLFVLSRQLIVVFDDPVGLASLTCMLLECLKQIRCAPIVQEEHTLADSPSRSRADLIRAGASLRDSVREVTSHMMQGQVGEEIGWHLG